MAFDFPNSPSVGQRVTGVGGIVYVWDGVKWASNIGSVTVQSMGDVGRNLIHNPLFNVAQRGAGPWTTTSNGAYTLDRWLLYTNTDTISITQAALNDADRGQIGDEAAEQCIFNTFTGNAAAAASTEIVQRIEKVRRLGGKSVTVSFWARVTSGAATKVGVSYAQVFGTGGSPSTAVLGAGTAVTISATWTRYNVTMAIPSVIGKTLGTAGDDSTQIEFWYTSGATNATRAGNIGVQSGGIAVWGVQLEVGSVATPLEKPDPQQDLAKCQRFARFINGSARGSASGAGQVTGGALGFAPMRATPTYSVISAGTASNVTGGVLSIESSYSANYEIISFAAGDYFIHTTIYFLTADL